jgi:uncharacterized protein (DUF433 family)
MAARTPTVNLTRYIDNRFFEGRPHIRGRRIPVWVIAYTLRDNKGYGVPELMYDFDLSEAEVLAALLYYQQHQAEIDAQEDAIREQYKHFYESDQPSS